MENRPHRRKSADEPRCAGKSCCSRRAGRPSGLPFCAAVCVCLVCSSRARAQEAPTEEAKSEEAKSEVQEKQPVAPPPREKPFETHPNEGSIEDESNDAPEAPHPKTTPPRVIETVDAAYPPDALGAGQEAIVQLLVTVRRDGTVGAVQVASSGGPAFDKAAAVAVEQWRFEPAHRGEEAIDSRIRVPFRFSLPKPESQDAIPEATLPNLTDSASPESATEESTSGEDEPIDVVVQGERDLRSEERSVSDFVLDRDLLASAPRREGAEVLRSAPGVYIGQGEGPAVAHNYMLRGFDAEHGQDIEFKVGGLPINLPSHIHGQGYADLGFMMGDVVQELHVTEGVSDPRQGDFAVAGSINVTLGVPDEDRGVRLQSGYGSFNTFKEFVRWAPKKMSEESFGAVQFTTTNGFGENRAGKSGSGLFQHRFGEGDLTYRVIGMLHAARSDMAGVVRRDDVASERVCFQCVYPYSTARAQNAMSGRFLAGFFADHEGKEGDNGQLGAWIGYDNFRVQENFTGFLQESRTLERVAGLGDLIEQQNRTFSLGLTGRYRTSPFRPADWAHGTLEVGADGRFDNIEQEQNLLDATARNQTWDERVDASIRSIDLGVYGDLDWSLSNYVNFRLGMRADLLSYDVDDRLGNFAPAVRPQESFIKGYRRSALGLAWGPRTSLEVLPIEWLSILAAYGEGYRSPQARQLDDGEKTPFSKVRSADWGVRFDWGEQLRLSIGGFYTRLSDDVAFDASEGRLERVGATQRLGAVAHAVTRPLPWLVGSASLTFVDATLLEPPPATADEPQPPYEEGQNLPYVPPLVVRADLGARHTFVENLGGQPLGGKAGLGLSYLSARPLPYGDFADPFTLLDASAGLVWGPFDLTFEAFNLLNTEYAAVEYSFPSDWDPNDGVRSRVPERHTAAGSPFSWMLSLGVTL